MSETGVEIAIGGDRLQGRSTQVDIDGPCESEIERVGKIDTRAVTTVEATGNERSEERSVGKEWSVRVDLGGRSIIKKNTAIQKVNIKSAKTYNRRQKNNNHQ